MWTYPSYIPPKDDCNVVLGKYISEWGNLELQLAILFHILLGTKIEISTTLFSVGFQTKTLVDLFKALGHFQLLESEQKHLKALCKRFNNAALKRNRIIHAQWILDRVSDKSDVAQWVRVFCPIDPVKQRQIFNELNQKTRVNYRFTINQLLTACKDIKTLSRDIGTFNGLISRRIEPLVSPEKP